MGSESSADENAPAFPLESAERLSRSLLWRLQRRYYREAGIEPWRTDAVPHHVTNNAAIAHAHAAVFLGYLRDCRAARPALDPREPLTVVELGAGSGRFAYLFLKAFTELCQEAAPVAAGLRYVMTDFAETNVQRFREHPKLRPFVEQGLLDFAVFDVEETRELRLLEAGTTIGPGGLRGPLGVIANYVLDSVPQDAFSLEGEELRECLISLATHEPVADAGDPSLLPRLVVRYDRRPAPPAYYGDDELDALLEGLAGSGMKGTILFPATAIRCLRRLAELTGGKLLLMAGDYGDREHPRRPADPLPALHGTSCFSMPVDYHAIRAWVLRRGGRVLDTAHRHAHLAVAGFLLGDHAGGHPETRLAYGLTVERAGPDDVFNLTQGTQGGLTRMGLVPVLSLIRLSCHDPRIVEMCLQALWGYLDTAPEELKGEVVTTLVRAFDRYYPIGEDLDLAFELGLLAHGYGGYREALGLFRESIRLHGDDPRTRFNMGLCHWQLGETEEALRALADTLRVDPQFKPTGALQVKDPPPEPVPQEPAP